jgi:outer membrane protein assembly factor BamA
MKADFQGKLGGNFRWLAGISFNKNTVDSVDIDKLNEGKSGDDLLPDVPGLYDYYVDWGVISKDQAKGGNNTFFKFGLVYDSRDIEANPSKGIWDEVILFVGPKAFGYEDFTTSALFAHRQYFTLLPNTLTFAYRLAYQTKLSGNIPFYMLPYYIDSKQTKDGFGGAKTIRGILRNRVVGNGVAFGNLEFRWKAIKTFLFKQNFYIALSAFMDAGRVVDPYEVDLSGVPSSIMLDNGLTYNPQEWFNVDDESIHASYGIGVHFALNQNFIVAVDYGRAIKKEDGTSGIYIGLNWLF